MLLTRMPARRVAAAAGGHRHRHPAGARNRLRPRRRPLVGDPRRATIRHTFNRVPDYPARAPTWSTDGGAAAGSRCRVLQRTRRRCPMSRRRPAHPRPSTATPRPAGCPTRCRPRWANGCRSTSTTRSPMPRSPITPSATAVGAQVRRLEVATANGTTTLRFDQPGKPVTVALPYGETPWVRITAVATDDGSPGVQFGITDFSVTQYDANGFAHPVNLRHTVEVPGPPPGSAVAQWDLGSELLGPPGLHREPRRRALRRGDGAGTRGAGQPEPNADRAGTDLGDPDGVGARPPGSDAGRPDRATGHGPRRRRLRPDRRAGLRLRRHRRRPADRVDRTAARRAAPGGAHADADAARAHRGRPR